MICRERCPQRSVREAAYKKDRWGLRSLHIGKEEKNE